MQKPFHSLRYFALAATISVFLLIVLGGLLRATGTAGSCPDWPTCFGKWTPPSLEATTGAGAFLDYLHRALTVLSAILILAVAWTSRRAAEGIRRPMLWALGLLAAQIALGAWLVLARQSAGAAWYSALHLSLSLLILAGLVVSTVLTFYPSSHTSSSALVENTDPSPFTPLRSLFTSTFTRLSLLTLAAFFLLLVSGALVAASGAGSACSGWPLCLPLGPAGWLSLGHRLVVLGTALLLGVLFWRAWLTQRSQPVVLVATTSATVLFFAQALMGARLVAGYPAYLLALHQATAVAAWAALIVQIIAVGLAGRTVEAEQAEASTAHGRKGLVRDFLMLTKPIVVALLLVTTFAGMVIGARSLPPLSLAFWTLLGGFMAAGGSGAINQYIDRFDDVKMQRTQKRPIPAGRLSPAEGLAFGVGMALASFYLVAAMVNLLAALLTLAGIVYYVLIYSLLLKKTTVQNIVIGGGAGAIPPLVGWAAATGGLNIPSLFLFAVVFMWTPPHFWALALVRRVDYARAGVPMLPVVRGEAETRWQIFLYTLELVGLTLLLPLFGLGGSVYLVGAGVLGGWLLLAAWKVWKQGGNKVAWKMYRYSSMYLAFLFVVLMLDALI